MNHPPIPPGSSFVADMLAMMRVDPTDTDSRILDGEGSANIGGRHGMAIIVREWIRIIAAVAAQEWRDELNRLLGKRGYFLTKDIPNAVKAESNITAWIAWRDEQAKHG